MRCEASRHGIASLLSEVGSLDLGLERGGVKILSVDGVPSAAVRYRLHHYQCGPRWPRSANVAEPKGSFLKWSLGELCVRLQGEAQ
jgi:hypothetical protein